MILSVSRRTDIPSAYPDWFMQRMREGFVLVRNPMNRRQVSKVLLTPELVDCIDAHLVESICGARLSLPISKPQRPGCGCASSIDIGAYDTCPNGCVYCYATRSKQAARCAVERQNPKSPILGAPLQGDEIITSRNCCSYLTLQTSFDEG